MIKLLLIYIVSISSYGQDNRAEPSASDKQFIQFIMQISDLCYWVDGQEANTFSVNAIPDGTCGPDKKDQVICSGTIRCQFEPGNNRNLDVANDDFPSINYEGVSCIGTRSEGKVQCGGQLGIKGCLQYALNSKLTKVEAHGHSTTLFEAVPEKVKDRGVN